MKPEQIVFIVTQQLSYVLKALLFSDIYILLMKRWPEPVGCSRLWVIIFSWKKEFDRSLAPSSGICPIKDSRKKTNPRKWAHKRIQYIFISFSKIIRKKRELESVTNKFAIISFIEFEHLHFLNLGGSCWFFSFSFPIFLTTVFLSDRCSFWSLRRLWKREDPDGLLA